MKIVTPAEMKEMDLRAVKEGLFTSLRLMQNAAEALYKEVASLMEQKGFDRVLLLAGPGNNGGDAYALACLLYPQYQPALLAVGGEERSADCEHYYQKCKQLGIPFVTEPQGYPLVVDGVFGTGFQGDLPQEIRQLFKSVTAPVLSIDIPSGMDGNSGKRSLDALKPIKTVTFAFYKPCHLLADCGEVVLADIGIPARYAEQIQRETLTPVVSPRDEWGYKNRYGMVALRVGAPQYSGAASLAILGALRSGAGLVYAYLPEEIRTPIASKFYGPILMPAEKFAYSPCTGYLFGSGVGRKSSVTREFKKIRQRGMPLVVDGDGLWHMKKAKCLNAWGPTVLTPHLYEFAHLLGITLEEVRENRIELAEKYAWEHNVVVVLKDAATVVTNGRDTSILSAPCSALAKGGSGDLLAGLLAGMMSGGMRPFDAAKTAVWLHNRAGHLALKEHSARAIQPEQMADYIDQAWMELEDGTF